MPFLCFTLLYEIHVSHEDRTMSVSLRLPEDLSQRLSSLASSDGSRGIVTVGVGGSSPQTGFEYERLPTFLTLFAGQCQVQSK